MIRFTLALIALFLAQPASAQGVVTSADPRATQAGHQILREGGSAVDAAMAMMLALTVVEPQSSGIGGGGFLIHHDAARGLTDTIDGRETAPAAATSDRFLNESGEPRGFFDAVAGGLSVGVPGNVRLMAMAHGRWGKLEWAKLFAPAIALAEDGFAVTPPLQSRIRQLAPRWKDFPAISALYLKPDGSVPAVGETIRNPELAETLRRIAVAGPDGFYVGTNAEAVIEAVAGASRNASDMTKMDLAQYRAVPRPPVCGHYRVYKICGMGPPSSGATTVLQILGMVERFDMAKLGKDSPVAWHAIGEAMQLAYADREKWLGDADFVAVPVAGLIDPAYLAKRSRMISGTKARSEHEAGNPPGSEPRTAALQPDIAGTTHFIAVDAAGNVASMTSTVEGPFGSQLVAGGFVLNNELTDFTFAPELDGAPVANRVAGGKRPLSSMSPTIVYNAQDRPIFAVGAAGGKTIIMQVAKAIVAHLDWGMSAQEAIGYGQIYFNDDGLILEQGTALEAMRAPLEAMGHKVAIRPLGLKANAVERTDDGWAGAADPRSVGTALQP